MKSKIKNTSLLLIIAFALFMGALISSCTETEVVPYEEEPTNRIIGYKVTNASEVLHGVVDDIDNTITVSVPYYISINYVVPEITLQEGATLIDSRGDAIDIREDLDPVPFDSVGYTYRVKDKNNAIRQYKLVTNIIPYKDPLKLGYAVKSDENGNVVADDTATSEVIINSPLTIYGNFESSSKNGKLTLIDKRTNKVIPNGLRLTDITRSAEIHYMTAQVAAEVDSGYYSIVVEHQGRIDTLPTIHMKYKMPFFDWLPRTYTTGDILTLNVRGSNLGGNYSGVNTGISRMYVRLIKSHFVRLPANFPQELFNKPLDVEIVSQNRTQVQIKLPELPRGIYESSISSGSGVDGYSLQYSGFGLYFDFKDSAWGKGNLLSTISHTSFEITAIK